MWESVNSFALQEAIPHNKLIGQQAEKLWGFFANNAISHRDLDL